MGAVVPTIVKATEFGGDYQLKIFTITPDAASNTIDLSSYFSEIVGARAHLTGGLDANLTHIQVAFATTTVTITQVKANGTTAASDWGTAAIEIWVVGKLNANSGS
jgi:hypothetical protein